MEFALVFPLFLYLLFSVIEMAFVFNGLSALNFATRNAALIAAEAGNLDAADCAVLRQVETDVTAPMAGSQIQQVQIYRANRVGDPYSGQADTYARTGSTACVIEGNAFTVPYSLTGAAQYAPASRCNQVKGCPSLSRTELDTIGVKIDYLYRPHLPMLLPWLGLFLTINGSDYIMSKSNVARMEPVL